MDERDLQRQLQALIRSFGLLNPDRTPCGQPMPISQAHALQVLGEHEGLPQQTLAAHLNLERSTVSRLVAQLVARGWVDKAVNPENRREVCLTLSSEGHAQLGQIREAAATKYRTIFERLPRHQRQQVLDALAILVVAVAEGAGT